MITTARVIQYVVVAVFLVAPVGCLGDEEPGAEDGLAPRQVTPDSPLVLRIAFAKYTFGRDELPRMLVTIHNPSDDFVWLTRPGDGSTVGWRTPILNWSALPVNTVEVKEHDQPVAVFPEPRLLKQGWCSISSNRSKPNIVLGIPADGTVRLSGWLGRPYFSKPGRYRVAFHYENNPEKLWLDGGGLSDRAIDYIKKSHPCSLVSNEVLVTVTQVEPQED